ncbi:MAG: hypothetical protein WBF58_02750 [Xanthobacteraceae bacterium]
MALRRRIFRIEQNAAAQSDCAPALPDGFRHSDIEHALAALRALIAAATSGSLAAVAAGESERARLFAEFERIAGAIDDNGEKAGGAGRQGVTSRIGHELGAVVESSEQATQKILAAAEEIDAAASALCVALGGRSEQRLAQDIQHRVVRIFEACNFQDLVGQRIAKGLAALQFVEVQIARVLEEITTASRTRALHGPRLDGDSGHISQDGVDAMFAGQRMTNNSE